MYKWIPFGETNFVRNGSSISQSTDYIPFYSFLNEFFSQSLHHHKNVWTRLEPLPEKDKYNHCRATHDERMFHILGHFFHTYFQLILSGNNKEVVDFLKWKIYKYDKQMKVYISILILSIALLFALETLIFFFILYETFYFTGRSMYTSDMNK